MDSRKAFNPKQHTGGGGRWRERGTEAGCQTRQEHLRVHDRPRGKLQRLFPQMAPQKDFANIVPPKLSGRGSLDPAGPRRCLDLHLRSSRPPGRVAPRLQRPLRLRTLLRGLASGPWCGAHAYGQSAGKFDRAGGLRAALRVRHHGIRACGARSLVLRRRGSAQGFPVGHAEERRRGDPCRGHPRGL